MDVPCLEFINSKWYETHKPYVEKLKDSEWLEQFCRKWALPIPDGFGQAVEALTRFRDEMREVALRFCAVRELSPEDIETINARLLLDRPQKRLVQENGGFRLADVPQSGGLDQFLYRIALSFAELITQYPPEYLKTCGNPDCGWIFYDDSKSHSRKWCDNRCASLMKVRKYRAGKKNASSPREGSCISE